jgi:hypothetical protein
MWKKSKKNKIIYFKTPVRMIEINNHICKLTDVHYSDRHFHIKEEDLNRRLGEYIDNYTELIDNVKNKWVDRVFENVFFIPAIHFCFCHAVIDHIFPYFWALNDIRKFNPEMVNFTLWIVERNVGLYYTKNDQLIEGLGQPGPKYKGVHKDLISLLSPDEHIFEVGIYNEDHYIFKNCYFYKREDEFQRSPWNCLDYYPQLGVRNHRNLKNLLFSDKKIIEQLRKFTKSVTSMVPISNEKEKDGKRCVIINRKDSIRSLDGKIHELIDLLTKQQEKYVSEDGEREKFLFGGVLYLEDLSFWQQVKVFLSNDIIITPHGSGLIHTIWSKDKLMIEVVFNEEDNPIYKRIADITKNQIIQIPYDKLLEDLPSHLPSGD